MVVMITGIDLSREIFAVNVLKILKSSLKYLRKHALWFLQLYGDQALKKAATAVMVIIPLNFARCT